MPAILIIVFGFLFVFYIYRAVKEPHLIQYHGPFGDLIRTGTVVIWAIHTIALLCGFSHPVLNLMIGFAISAILHLIFQTFLSLKFYTPFMAHTLRIGEKIWIVEDEVIEEKYIKDFGPGEQVVYPKHFTTQLEYSIRLHVKAKPSAALAGHYGLPHERKTGLPTTQIIGTSISISNTADALSHEIESARAKGLKKWKPLKKARFHTIGPFIVEILWIEIE